MWTPPNHVCVRLLGLLVTAIVTLYAIPALSQQSSAPETGYYRASHALVMGLADYCRWGALDGVPTGMSAVKEALEWVGFQVQPIVTTAGRQPSCETAQPSGEAILNTIRS